MVYPLAAFLRGVERPFLFLEGRFSFQSSLRASSPIWESEASLARTRERAAKPFAFLRPSLARSREARFGSPKQGACSQAISSLDVWFEGVTDWQSGGLRFKSFTDL